MSNQVLQTLGSYWPLLAFGCLLLRSLYRRYLHPLHTVPGPFLGSITSLWWLSVFLFGKEQYRKPILLHAQYGPIVRIRPNTVIIHDPKYFPEFFTWDKSDFFLAFRSHSTVIGHGGELDIELHNQKKRNVMGGFAMSQILKNEANMDKMVMRFLDRLDEKKNTIFDIGPWTQFATFDVATQMLFSEPVGFVKEGRDVDNVISSLHGLLSFVGVAGLHPWIAKILFHPRLFPLIGPKPTDKTGPGALHGFTYKQLDKRLAKKDSDSSPPDVFQWIMEHKDKEGQHMSRAMLEQEGVGMILAASDTTAATLRALILTISSNSRILNKLREQIDGADAKAALSTPPSYSELLAHVPYVELLFKEAQRAYPIVGIPLPKKAPKNGAHVSGHFLPGGTEVGLSQWAVGYNPNIWGEDVALFKPERWSEDLSHDPAAQRRRDQAEVWFSGGHTLCTGRNVALLEVYKITTQLFRTFNVEVVNNAQPWKVQAEVAMIHTDFFVKLTERKRSNGEDVQ
ncbi:hypothetical protein H2200_002875 [Cladophialophora chaetospira]|uniref:Pisatin demethylase n=1 Tax=Cladophialophora chaetospira TaxID=386627 RepID=A0AA39CKY8_9EURO|nr:hypothetical protein H2200_002875 [Cladophialophora chaetospira]